MSLIMFRSSIICVSANCPSNTLNISYNQKLRKYLTFTFYPRYSTRISISPPSNEEDCTVIVTEQNYFSAVNTIHFIYGSSVKYNPRICLCKRNSITSRFAHYLKNLLTLQIKFPPRRIDSYNPPFRESRRGKKHAVRQRSCFPKKKQQLNPALTH